ncbi:hypothetical protein A9Z60_02395 [Moraxella nonliquefaciens]|uniref:Solute-binding protein family 3/N-terminal domain-containing protein n=2 Tax=Moraxella nonliquefaciens TaxID=478 RepID=A0A1B8PN65_MORNO|nr:hypothetical protein A9Z60_02395 [Moraxella nonliquefaciens]
MKHTVFFNQGVMIGVICIIGLLSACGKKQSTTQNTDDTNISTKTIQVAVNSNMPPFAYIDDKGNPIGFDVEVITHIAQKNGYTVKFNILPWQDMFKSVEQNISDLAISSISYTTEREGKYLLSNPYVYMPAGVLSLNDTTINSMSDLKPMRLGVQDGAIFVDVAMSFQDLINGKVDAIMSDKQIVQHFAKSYPQYKTNLLEYGNVNDKGSYAVAIAPKNKTQIINMFNQGLSDMRATGELTKLEEKWFEK